MYWFIMCCRDKKLTESHVGRRGFHVASTSRNTQGGNVRQEPGDRNEGRDGRETLLTFLLTMTFSAHALMYTRATCQR